MKVDIHEVRGPLSQFYPDPAVRQEVHYAFAHRFLPQYTHRNPFAFFSSLYRRIPGLEDLDPAMYIHTRWSAIFEPAAGLVPREDVVRDGMTLRRVEDLGAELCSVGGRPAALVVMPAPERPPLAHFVCAVLLVDPAQGSPWPRDAKCRIFTLEVHSAEGPDASTGLVCEWTAEGQHRNFGVAVPADRRQFVEAIAALVARPDEPTAGSFMPPSDASPGLITVGNPPAIGAGSGAPAAAKAPPPPPPTRASSPTSPPRRSRWQFW